MAETLKPSTGPEERQRAPTGPRLRPGDPEPGVTDGSVYHGTSGRRSHHPRPGHVEAVIRALPVRYRLPVLAWDATGDADLGAHLTHLGDVDEPAGRWRVCPDTSKTGMARWIDPVDPDIHAAVCALTPCEDRDLDARVFPHLEDTRLRRAITRACKATGTPHWSPHDLRHRRVSLLVLRGTPIPRVSAYVGHARGSMTLDTYAHVLLNGSELDYTALIA